MSNRTANFVCGLITVFTFALIGISFGTTPHDGEMTHHQPTHSRIHD